MHPAILPPARVEQTKLFIVVCPPPVKKKENYELKPVKLFLKIDFVWHPACAQGLVNTYTHTHTHTYIYIYIYIYIRFEKKKLFRNYSRTLRTILNKSLNQYPTKQ